MTGIAYPFLRAPDACILAAPWVLLEEGVPIEVEDGALAHFDYSTALSASRQVAFNLEALAEALRIEASTLVVRLCVLVGTGGARLERARRVAFSADLTAGHAAVPVEITVDSGDMSGALHITTELVLVEGRPLSRLSPTHMGSRLWRDSFRVDLEPSLPRFPIETVSFSRMFDDGPSGALWYLDWGPADLERDFTSAVRLYLNEDNAELVEAVHQSHETIVRVIMTAVALQMIRTALASDAFDPDEARYAPSSVAATIHGWIGQAFPGQSIAAVRTLARHDPARFEASVAAMTIEVPQDG